ncbi:PQQ-dependent sugar dehydrogenase [Dokdonella koreensis]|uniref:Glucose/sorbosone dehydrogenase n=1 Tax=Dokdonella koreensis DS-123 TaxID=1300342 RepID=A0A160DW43_9GAMM|nr:PQQ-dependent sugar dehydrogenase [Dokdonella koreensis]ANB18440.1 Glucose/sorbosone dehydrogenase [Dokdonella koreensis DS-123]
MRTLIALTALALAGCGARPTGGGEAAAAPVASPNWPATPATETLTSEKGPFRVTELVTGLVHPWSLAFLPDGRMLVTERPGRLRIIGNGAVSAPLAGVPAVYGEGQGGLLDVAVSPQFAEDRLVYLSYAEADGDNAGTAVARARLEGDALQGLTVIYRQSPKLSQGAHFGSRLVFDDQGFLFVTQGEHNKRAMAQDLDKLQGKLVRLRPDGSVPDDNPFVGRPYARPAIWSYGHRNMQGAALHPVTRALWTSEHGPRGGDELNIPQAGRNYGWPIITYGINYSGLPIPEAKGEAADGLEQPLHYWKVSPGLSGMAFLADGGSAWNGNLFLGALATRELIRLELDGDRVAHEERLLTARKWRIRDVRQGPDGKLYVLTDEDDGRLLRIDPPGSTP